MRKTIELFTILPEAFLLLLIVIGLLGWYVFVFTLMLS